MPARTDENGNNYADELDYMLFNPVLDNYKYISLDEAIGKVIVMTTVSPYDGQVTIYVRTKND